MINTIIEIWFEKNLTLKTFEHLYMFGIALILAIIIGVILGFYIFKYPKLANIFFNILNVVETIPTIALLIILIPIFGIGSSPTIAACVIYSILPIARNTYTGISSVDKKYIEIADGVGLTKGEILFKVRIPLALPLIIGGIRIAIVFTMGVVTLGGLIAAGGIGESIQSSIATLDIDAIIVAALWVGFLAVIFDGIAGYIEKILQRRFA
ncbi:ABC transporter permease [Thermoplasmatota archaeon]